jgi:hypothetical protein
MLPHVPPVYRCSIQERKQLDTSRDAAAKARELLRVFSTPDTFLGRKTQERFPNEEAKRDDD